MKSITLAAIGVVAAATAFVVFVPNYTGPPNAAKQVGFPQQVVFETDAMRDPVNTVPAPLPPAESGGPKATAVYQNVQVLTDVSAAEFMRLQQALTAWVAPKQGCAFCHAGTDYASDAKPQKAVARVMLQMTRHLNTDWSNHVSGAGVTCYTCHRGQPVPSEIWFPSTPAKQRPFIGRQENWREAADTVRKFFPDAGFAEYFYDDQPIEVQSSTAAPSHTISSQVETKRIYEMMMQMSDGIGANCGYCHNTRAFQNWDQSSPYRWNGYHAIRLVRDLNRNYLRHAAELLPQTRTLVGETRLPVLPPREQGAQLGNGLVVCATCHVGITKPLNGVNMVNDYPGLGGPVSAQPIAAPPPAEPSDARPALQAQR